jgi:hypothetical protein
VKDRNKRMFEPNDTTPEDVTDLDAFSSDFFEETKKEEVKEEPKEDVTPEDEPVEDDTQNDEPEGDNDDDPKEDDNDKPEEKPKKVNRFQERINELTAKAREAERAREALEAKLAEVAKQETPKSTPQVEAKGPQPDDKNEDGSEKYPLGEFDPTYIRDLTRHTIQAETEQAKRQEAQERAQRQEQEAREALDQQWQEKLTPVVESHEDFIEKTLGLETAFEGLDPNYSDYLVNTIKSLDHGPEVLYYFANNLPEAQKFVRMGPLAATLALGEYNAMFKGQSRKGTKVSSAPPPPQVNKGSKTRTVVAGDTDDLDAFETVFYKRK